MNGCDKAKVDSIEDDKMDIKVEDNIKIGKCKVDELIKGVDLALLNITNSQRKLLDLSNGNVTKDLQISQNIESKNETSGNLNNQKANLDTVNEGANTALNSTLRSTGEVQALKPSKRELEEPITKLRVLELKKDMIGISKIIKLYQAKNYENQELYQRLENSAHLLSEYRLVCSQAKKLKTTCSDLTDKYNKLYERTFDYLGPNDFKKQCEELKIKISGLEAYNEQLKAAAELNKSSDKLVVKLEKELAFAKKDNEVYLNRILRLENLVKKKKDEMSVQSMEIMELQKMIKEKEQTVSLANELVDKVEKIEKKNEKLEGILKGYELDFEVLINYLNDILNGEAFVDPLTLIVELRQAEGPIGRILEKLGDLASLQHQLQTLSRELNKLREDNIKLEYQIGNNNKEINSLKDNLDQNKSNNKISNNQLELDTSQNASGENILNKIKEESTSDIKGAEVDLIKRENLILLKQIENLKDKLEAQSSNKVLNQFENCSDSDSLFKIEDEPFFQGELSMQNSFNSIEFEPQGESSSVLDKKLTQLQEDNSLLKKRLIEAESRVEDLERQLKRLKQDNQFENQLNSKSGKYSNISRFQHSLKPWEKLKFYKPKDDNNDLSALQIRKKELDKKTSYFHNERVVLQDTLNSSLDKIEDLKDQLKQIRTISNFNILPTNL